MLICLKYKSTSAYSKSYGGISWSVADAVCDGVMFIVGDWSLGGTAV